MGLKLSTPRPSADERNCSLIAAGKRILERLEDRIGECDCEECEKERSEATADVAALLALFSQGQELRRRLVQATLELEHAAQAGYNAKQAAIVTLPFVEGALRMSLPIVSSGESIEGPGE